MSRSQIGAGLWLAIAIIQGALCAKNAETWGVLYYIPITMLASLLFVSRLKEYLNED